VVTAWSLVRRSTSSNLARFRSVI